MKLYKIIKYTLTIIPFITLVIFIDPSLHVNYGEYAWKILVIILFLRPLRDIFPEIKILSKVVTLRKELGIISGVFGLAHIIGYFLLHKLPVSFLFNGIMWDPRGYLGWGMFSFIVCIVLTGTSNIYSIKKLGKKWKIIQKLSYLMLIFTGIHIALVKPESLISIIATISSYLIIYILAILYKK